MIFLNVMCSFRCDKCKLLQSVGGTRMFLMTLHCNPSQANIMIHPGKINYCLEKRQSILICNSNISLLEPIVNCLGYKVFSKLLWNFVIHSVFFTLPHPGHPYICLVYTKKMALKAWKAICYNPMGKKIALVVIVNNIQDLKLELQRVSGGHLSPQLGNVTNRQNQLDVLGCY